MNQKSGQNTRFLLALSVLFALSLLLPASLFSQQKELQQLQNIVAEHAQRLDAQASRIPSENALEKLNQLDQLSEEIRSLQEAVKKLNQHFLNLEVQKITDEQSKLSLEQHLLLGMLALQAGNANNAVDHLAPYLEQKETVLPKAELLMALGKGFATQGFHQQAASYFGTLIQKYAQSPLLPRALFQLGSVFGKMQKFDKQKIIWKDLIERYPTHPLSKTAQRKIEVIAAVRSTVD